MSKERILSGAQPTGLLHLGNWEGAVKNWAALQDDYECYFFVADWHALTTVAEPGDSEQVRERTYQVAADFIAGGLDPEKCAIFVQSDVKEHAELYLLLGMISPVGWLERVPTYKEKRDNLHIANPSYGLLGYPVLQAADILLYRPKYVPVGKDQVAHLELSREIARRFNHLFGEVFPEPQPKLTQFPLLPGTDGRKMSKSYENAIYMSDAVDEVNRKVKNMFTDPTKIQRTDPGHPETCPVCQLQVVYTPEYEKYHQLEREGSAEWGCVKNKKLLAECINKALAPVREKREEMLRDRSVIEEILHEGAKKARRTANETLQVVREAIKIGIR